MALHIRWENGERVWYDGSEKILWIRTGSNGLRLGDDIPLSFGDDDDANLKFNTTTGLFEANDLFDAPYVPVRRFLKKGRLFIPTLAYGWTSATSGSGGTSNSASYLYVKTGTTASSEGKYYSVLNCGFNNGETWSDRIDWRKKLYIAFMVRRLNSDSEVNAYCQIKEANTHGQLAERGLGVAISNMTLSGESYGTARGTTGSVAMTHAYPCYVQIVHNPDQGQIEWFVNGTSIGTETTAANIPNALGTTSVYWVMSIANGATGGVDAQLLMSLPLVYQEI